MNTTTDIPGAKSPAATLYRLDPEASMAEFRVRTFWGLTTVRGRFDRLDGFFEVDAGGRRRMTLTIAAASLNTDNHRRDRHLRSADFFDCERHPEVHFHSTHITDAGDDHIHVEGELQAAGHRIALALRPTMTRAGDDQIDIRAETAVDQHQLGMTSTRFGIQTPASLTVHAHLRACRRTRANHPPDRDCG